VTYCANIVTETAMGVKINAQEQTESEFVKTIYWWAHCFGVLLVVVVIVAVIRHGSRIYLRKLYVLSRTKDEVKGDQIGLPKDKTPVQLEPIEKNRQNRSSAVGRRRERVVSPSHVYKTQLNSTQLAVEMSRVGRHAFGLSVLDIVVRASSDAPHS